jgi:predicted metalloprotease
VRAGLLVVLAVLLCGCTTVVAGHASPASSPGSSSVAEPCGSAGAPAEVVRCLTADVTRFWSAQLGRSVTEAMVADPPRASVPRDCQAALGLGTAFYCPDNGTVYLTGALISRGRTAYGADLPYALAAVVGHEFGHAVQDLVHQPGFNSPDLAASRRIEQQADCLLGVWAHNAANRGLLDPARLLAITRREYTTVEQLPPPPALPDYNERASHGTVTERVTALSRGLTTGTPNACALTGT